MEGLEFGPERPDKPLNNHGAIEEEKIAAIEFVYESGLHFMAFL